MGIEKRHLPGELDTKVRFARGPDGKLRVEDPARGVVRPETIAEERPPQAPDPRRDVDIIVGPPV